jgi:hypothetical protein
MQGLGQPREKGSPSSSSGKEIGHVQEDVGRQCWQGKRHLVGASGSRRPSYAVTYSNDLKIKRGSDLS